MVLRNGQPLLAVAGALVGLSLAGCGGSGGPHEPDFSVCAGSGAGPLEVGATISSASNAYLATLTAVHTDASPPVDAPAIGFATFTVALTDANGMPAGGVVIRAEKPYMPLHGHSASTFPEVAIQEPGTYIISKIHFFMGGYWQVTLDLDQDPTAGETGTVTPDKAVFSLCVPN